MKDEKKEPGTGSEWWIAGPVLVLRLHELTKFCFVSKRMESVSLFAVMETVNDQSDHV